MLTTEIKNEVLKSVGDLLNRGTTEIYLEALEEMFFSALEKEDFSEGEIKKNVISCYRHVKELLVKLERLDKENNSQLFQLYRLEN